MALKYTNNASTELSGSVTTSATSITVANASKFPTIGAGDYTYVTLAKADASAVEVVRVTATSGTTFTIVRAQDNTAAHAFDSGDLCELRITSALLTDALDSVVEGISDRKDYVIGTAAGSYTGSTTVFPVAYDVGYIDVYLNGVRLDPSDYSATDNDFVTLAAAGGVGDVITCIGWGTFVLNNTGLTDLKDVNAPNPIDGEALTFDSATNSWVASTSFTLPTASASVLGAVKVGANLTMTNGVLAGVNSYTHPSGAGNEHMPSSVSQTEASYLDGVTSSIQTQLNAKPNASDVNLKTVPIQEHIHTITSNYTVPTGKNAFVTGAMTIALGASITVNAGSTFSFL